MIEDLEFEEFYRVMRAEISDESEDTLQSDYRIDRLTEYFINQMGDFGVVTDANVCFFDKPMGSARAVSNGWYVDAEEGRLSLFITLFKDSETPEAVGKQELKKAVKQAARVFAFANKIDLDELEPSSKELSMIRTIKEALNSITQIRVHVLTDGLMKNTGDTESHIEELPVYISFWDSQRLYRLVSSGREYEPIEIDFKEKFGSTIGCLSMPANNEEYQGYLAILPGSWLAALYAEYGSRLMELNVRSFLTQRVKVNRNIRKTILNEPNRFLAYNNGISATAEAIQTERSPNGDLSIRRIKGLQIVNGGQTVASIHRAKKVDRCDHLDQLGVQAKITVVKKELLEELVPMISRYSNSQNAVNEADFASNDPFHVQIENLANSVWAPGEQTRWFYERARGQYEVARNRIAGTSAARRRTFDAQTPKSQKFTKTDLAKYYNCWEKKPEVVGTGAQKNFLNVMTSLAKDRLGFIPDEDFYKDLVAKAILYKAAEKVARKCKFPSYRANAVAYTISLLSFKTVGRLNLRSIWERQAVPESVQTLLEDWMPVVWEELVDSAGQRNVTEWAKKLECWEHIQLIDQPMPEGFEDELRDGDPLPTVGSKARRGKAAELSTIERQNINRVIQQDADTWWKIGLWGEKNGELTGLQASVVFTIAAYAAGDWDKIPSAKQSKHCVAALDLYQQAQREQMDSEDLPTPPSDEDFDPVRI
ncbi:AIPR family protein [Pseudomonadota bacterium]